MGATTQKVYQISVELGNAQQQLADAGKLLENLKTKAAAANQEVKETKEIYQENTASLKELVTQQKALEAAKKSASAGAPAVVANNNLKKNLAEQKLLNSIIQESKIDYQDAKAAAEAAGAAVAKQALSVKDLAGGVKEYEAAAKSAAKEFAPGTVGAIRQETEALRASLENLVPGSAEAAAAIQQLGAKESTLRGLALATAAANPRAQARAFTVLAGALTGVVGIATSAAQVFGLSSSTAQEYAQKMQGLVGVLYSVEQLNKALNSENISLIKSIIFTGKSYLAAGEAASTGSKITRAALISTGIGALVVLVGTLVSLWVEFGGTVSSSESKFTRFKATVVGGFYAMLAIIKDVVKAHYQLFTFDFAGLAKTYNNLGKDTAEAYAKGRAGVIADAHRKENELIIAAYARQIELAKAKGQDVSALEIANSARKLANLKNESEEEKKIYLDTQNELAVLRAQQAKRINEEFDASYLAYRNGKTAREAAQGKATFALELAAKEAQLQNLLAAELRGEHIAQDARIQLESEIDSLKLAHDKELADKRRALLSAQLDAQLVVIREKTSEQSLIALEANAKEIQIAKQHRATLLAQGQVDAAAVVAADSALYKLRAERSRIFRREEAEQAQFHRDLYPQAIAHIRDRDIALEKQYRADLNRAQAAGARVTKQVADELATALEFRRRKAESDADQGGRLLIRLFGLTDEQAQRTKEKINEFVSQASNLVYSVMGIAQDAADQRLQETQDVLQKVTQQLSDAQAAADDTAGKLESASGARKDYLIGKLKAQRAEEERLAGVKAKAALAEAAAEREKQKLTKESTQLTLAGALASTVATGAKSVESAVDVISGAAKLPFPASLFAVGAGLAVVVAALAQARAIGKTFANGGLVDGPSHAQGGIQMWHKSGAHLGEMEGGEMVVNKQATANNLGLLKLINNAGRTRVIAPPSGHFANGGLTGQGQGNTSAGAGQVVIQAADLSELVDTSRAMLSHMQTVAAATSTTAGYGPARLNIGPYEATQISAEKDKADQAQAFGTL